MSSFVAEARLEDCGYSLPLQLGHCCQKDVQMIGVDKICERDGLQFLPRPTKRAFPDRIQLFQIELIVHKSSLACSKKTWKMFILDLLP